MSIPDTWILDDLRAAAGQVRSKSYPPSGTGPDQWNSYSSTRAMVTTAGIEASGDISEKAGPIRLLQRQLSRPAESRDPWVVAAVLENVPPEILHAAIDPSRHDTEAVRDLARNVAKNLARSTVVPAPLNAAASRIVALPENRWWVGRPSFGKDPDRAPRREVDPHALSWYHPHVENLATAEVPGHPGKPEFRLYGMRDAFQEDPTFLACRDTGPDHGGGVLLMVGDYRETQAAMAALEAVAGQTVTSPRTAFFTSYERWNDQSWGKRLGELLPHIGAEAGLVVVADERDTEILKRDLPQRGVRVAAFLGERELTGGPAAVAERLDAALAPPRRGLPDQVAKARTAGATRLGTTKR